MHNNNNNNLHKFVFKPLIQYLVFYRLEMEVFKYFISFCLTLFAFYGFRFFIYIYKHSSFRKQQVTEKQLY